MPNTRPIVYRPESTRPTIPHTAPELTDFVGKPAPGSFAENHIMAFQESGGAKSTGVTVSDLQGATSAAQSTANQAVGDAAAAHAAANAAQATADAPHHSIVLAAGTTTARTLADRFGQVLNPLDFGAVGDGVADDTDAVQACLDAAVDGSLIEITALHAVSGVTMTRGTGRTGRITIRCRSGAMAKGAMAAGLVAIGDQDYLIKIGEVGVGEINNIVFDNLALDGGGHEIAKGLIWAVRASQIHFRSVSFRKAVGPGLYCNKLEDAVFVACQFVYLGSAGLGAVVYGGKPEASEPHGNNVSHFFGCRFEFFDGGAIQTLSDGQPAAINHLFIIGTKFEVAADEGWGESRGDHPIVNMADASASVGNILFSGCHFAQIESAATLLRLGNANNFRFINNLLQHNNTTVNLLHVADPSGDPVAVRGLEFRDNTARVASMQTGDVVYQIINKNTWPHWYEFPRLLGTEPGNLERVRVDGLIYGHEIAAQGRVVPDPDPVTDKCISPAGAVAATSGSNNNAIAFLGYATEQTAGVSVGIGPHSPRFILLRMRAKKSGGGGADAYLNIRNGGNLIAQITLSSESWEWVEAWVDSEKFVAGSVQITNSINNAANHAIFLDAVHVEYPSNLRRAEPPSTGEWRQGDRVYSTTPAAGGNVGWVCIESGSPGTWKAFGEIES